MASFPVSCDLFCTVIDNYGDAGVCWRLARQLATEQAWAVRLWIDDPATIDLLAPNQTLIDVRAWTDDFVSSEAADVVIEAFACNLPPTYIAAMKARQRPPVWINLEYLSAEEWVAGCHGLPSPQAGLEKYFFFPGFVAGTGGLLRERDLAVTQKLTFEGPLEISLFCYDNPQLPRPARCLARRRPADCLPRLRRSAAARRSPAGWARISPLAPPSNVAT